MGSNGLPSIIVSKSSYSIKHKTNGCKIVFLKCVMAYQNRYKYIFNVFMLMFYFSFFLFIQRSVSLLFTNEWLHKKQRLHKKYICVHLIRLRQKHGNDWATIGAVLGRSASSVKDRCRLMKDTCHTGQCMQLNDCFVNISFQPDLNWIQSISLPYLLNDALCFYFS